MKIDSAFVVMVLRLILCNEKMLVWLRSEAAKTDTPLDDTALKVVEYLLCDGDK